MLAKNNNLTDSNNDLNMVIKDTSLYQLPISYKKTNKLVTALYMVTDIIDKNEPLRNKLRTLGIGIISDIYTQPMDACRKVSELMSLLDIASSIHIISPMNCNILRREFVELGHSIQELGDGESILARVEKKINLAGFFDEEESKDLSISHERNSHSLGVQKGRTLLKAIKDMSNKVPAPYVPPWRDGLRSDRNQRHQTAQDFSVLKKKRREDIVNIIKILGGSATITDIKDKTKALPAGVGSLANCGEKTLQRELVSMLKDGVLYKEGSKRWTQYLIKN